MYIILCIKIDKIILLWNYICNNYNLFCFNYVIMIIYLYNMYICMEF